MKTTENIDILPDFPSGLLADVSFMSRSVFECIDGTTIGIRDTPIIVRAIHLAPPRGQRVNELYTRSEHPDQMLVNFESEIRSKAYNRMFQEKFDPAFFDDTDMHAPYCLHIVYDQETGTPLASARSFTFRDDLIKELEGTGEGMLSMRLLKRRPEKIDAASILHPGENHNFMVDRLSQILDVHIYRGIPKRAIFGLLYRSIFITYREYNYVYALARIEASHILLAKYIPLGLQIIGFTNFKVGETEKKHWVLVGNISRIRKELPYTCGLLLSIYE